MEKEEKIGLAIAGALVLGGIIYLSVTQKTEDALAPAGTDPEATKPPAKPKSPHTGAQAPAKPKPVVPAKPSPKAPPVKPTPEAKTLSQKIDDKKGTFVKSIGDATAVYYIADSTGFKVFKKGEGVGRVGDNLNNGYHRLFEVPGDDSLKGLKISDQFLKGMLKL